MTHAPGIALAAALFAIAATPAGADRLDDVVTEQMRVSRIPAVTIAVVRRGRPVAVRAYGTANLEWNARADTDTRFQLASVTKIVTGLLLMRLVEQGRLSLDDPLTRWFPDAPATWRGIRVRQLANHSSGLSDDLKVEGRRTVDAIVRAAIATPLAYRPGSEARYGFTDFTVLRAVMEKAGGKPLATLLRDELTGPLGLAATGFADAREDDGVRYADVLPKRASTYGLSEGRLATADFFFEPAGYGAGGLYSSAADLARLFAAIDRGTVIRAESLAELETPAKLEGGKVGGFGVGWTARTYRGVPIVGHSGGPALADIVRVEADQLTVVVLTNQQTFYPLLAERVLDLYLTHPIDAPALPDDRPAATARVRAILSGQAAPGEAAVAAPLRSPFGQALLTGVGAVRQVELVGETRPDGACTRDRTYRVRFERRAMTWRVAVGCKDEVTALRPD